MFLKTFGDVLKIVWCLYFRVKFRLCYLTGRGRSHHMLIAKTFWRHFEDFRGQIFLIIWHMYILNTVVLRQSSWKLFVHNINMHLFAYIAAYGLCRSYFMYYIHASANFLLARCLLECGLWKGLYDQCTYITYVNVLYRQSVCRYTGTLA